MKNPIRQYTVLDQVIGFVDQGLRSIFYTPITSQRENPAVLVKETMLTNKEKSHSAGLMRVNHVGEVCAQALYQGQAITARKDEVKQAMQHSADEEIDHLVWCHQRLQELGSRVSYLNPLWYLGALSIGIIAGIAGDKWSLGFVAETERQVVQHLNNHLQQLPKHDDKSRAILRQMVEDEEHHATVAYEIGAVNLPAPIQQIMAMSAKIMTTTAYWV
jgi:ubiquinone biosynthesis monooxygenase Coq7